MDHNSHEAIERRDVRRARRQNEIERIEAIDRLADRLLAMPKYDDTPATEVWDAARDIVDGLQDMHSAWAADRAMVADMEREGLL